MGLAFTLLLYLLQYIPITIYMSISSIKPTPWEPILCFKYWCNPDISCGAWNSYERNTKFTEWMTVLDPDDMVKECPMMVAGE